MRDRSLRVDTQALKGFVVKVFESLEVPPADAEITADVLVEADLRGIDSHGVARLQRYVSRLREGLIEPKVEVRVVHETPATALLDGGNGLGQVVGAWAMERCIRKADGVGAAFVSVRNSNHYGIAGYYAMMALPHDMIGLSLTNSRPLVVPTFGKQAVLGTNPISMAVPTKEERPFVLDMATSIVPMGKVEVAHRKGESLPPGWAVDGEGRPTTDAATVLAGGGLLPLGGTRELGGHKGYGLSAMVDILCGVLSGAGYGAVMSRVPGVSKVGHFFAAMRVDGFRLVDEFKAMMDEMIRELKSSAKAEGQDRIYIHGEIEFEMEEERRREGIPLHPKVVASLRQIGQELGVQFYI